MVELICLACGRTNPSDAKFCSGCGAALLRRFCEQCHAVNDAEAHFCRACGTALSAQLVPATSVPRPDDRREDAPAGHPPRALIPTLNEVVATDEAGVATTAPTLQPWQGPAPADAAAVPWGDSAPQATRPAHRTVLLAVGGLVALLVAVALWSRAPRTDVRPHDPDTASTPGATSADVPAPRPTPSIPTAPVSTTAPATTTAPASAPATTTAPATATGSSAPVEGSAPATSAVPKAAEPGSEALPAPLDTPRPATPPPSIAAEPRRPAATNRPPRGTATPAPAPSPRPAPECTPQLDALGLCAPGATITRR